MLEKDLATAQEQVAVLVALAGEDVQGTSVNSPSTSVEGGYQTNTDQLEDELRRARKEIDALTEMVQLASQFGHEHQADARRLSNPDREEHGKQGQRCSRIEEHCGVGLRGLGAWSKPASWRLSEVQIEGLKGTARRPIYLMHYMRRPTCWRPACCGVVAWSFRRGG